MTRAERRRAAKPQSAAHVHRMIKDVAVQMAHEKYDTLMANNDWYAMWRKRVEAHAGATVTPKVLEEKWVGLAWQELIVPARAALAATLAPGASPNLDEASKMRIHEALLQDHTLLRGRTHPMNIVGAQRPN